MKLPKLTIPQLSGDQHKLRIISGLIMAAGLLICLFLGGWPLRIAITAVALLALWEFFHMFWQKAAVHLPDKYAAYIAGAILCLGSGTYIGAAGVVAIIGAVAAFCAIRFLLEYGEGHDDASLPPHCLTLFAICYIPLTLQTALHMSLAEQFLILFASIGSDTGAYYVGCHFGKHKIWPRVSPKKSWEGSFGGMFTSMIAVTIFATLVKIPGMEEVYLIEWVLIGALLSIAAQFGDFFESALKRVQGVKDSSNIIPGHGGVLDRIDSLLFALPAYMLIKALLTGSLLVL